MCRKVCPDGRCLSCKSLWDERAELERVVSRGGSKLFPAWKDIRVRAEAKTAVKAAKDFLAAVLAGDKPGSLILQGDVGRGKTWIARAILRELYLPLDVRRSWLDRTLWVNERDVFSRLQRAMDVGDEYGARQIKHDVHEILRAATATQILFWDDLWVQKPGEWRDNILYDVFEPRTAKGLPSVITTNIEPAQGESLIAERVRSRVYANAVRVTVGGPDWRLRR